MERNGLAGVGIGEVTCVVMKGEGVGREEERGQNGVIT